MSKRKLQSTYDILELVWEHAAEAKESMEAGHNSSDDEAIANAASSVIRYLNDDRIDIDAPDGDGLTALWWHLHKGKDDDSFTVRLFLACGAAASMDVVKLASGGMPNTPADRTESLRVLVKHGKPTKEALAAARSLATKQNNKTALSFLPA